MPYLFKDIKHKIDMTCAAGFQSTVGAIFVNYQQEVLFTGGEVAHITSLGLTRALATDMHSFELDSSSNATPYYKLVNITRRDLVTDIYDKAIVWETLKTA